MFGERKIKNVSALTSRRERVKRGFQGGDFIEPFWKFRWIDEFRGLFILHSQTGFLNIDGFIDLGFHDRFDLEDFADSGKANPATRLRILRLPNQNPGGVFSQGALEKQYRTVIDKCMQQQVILVLKRVTRNAPFQFPGKPEVETDRSQLPHVLFPLFGYHSIEEAKQNSGMVRAFERLKKEGLVKHLAISQHHYNSIGGDMAWEIMHYLADNRPYEATQFFHTYGDRKEVAEWIEVAKKKDIGTIAMKTMGGVGRAANDEKFKKLLADPKFQGSTPASAMVKWLRSNENLTAAVIANKNFDQFRENTLAAASLAMKPQDHAALGLLAGHNKGLTCLLCAECVSVCPEHIAIADIFRYERYARDYYDVDRARKEYASLTRNGTACVGCGDCLPTCSQEIDIPAKLKDVHRLLG